MKRANLPVGKIAKITNVSPATVSRVLNHPELVNKETRDLIEKAITDWTEYYNTDRYQWDLAKLAPVEYYKYLTTGVYPLITPKAKGYKAQSEALQ